MDEVPEPVRALAASRGYTRPRRIGAGLEFLAFGATAPDGTELVLRTPAGPRFTGNANDPRVDTRALLRWEQAVGTHLHGHGFPVAPVRELVLGEPDVLITGFLPDDGAGADQHRLGALLHHLHRLPVPGPPPVANAGRPTAQVLAERIGARWAALAELVPDLPEPPHPGLLTEVLAARPAEGLVHLDVRAANLRCVGGRVHGLLDWSNALLAEPALELARLAEFALVPGNGVDAAAVFAGYPAPVPTEDPVFWIYRLDAAVMLALVFRAEAPDPERGPVAVRRVLAVRERLLRALHG